MIRRSGFTTAPAFSEVSRRPNYYPGPDGKAAAALVLRRDLV